MKKIEASRIHFTLLVIGTAYYIFMFSGIVSMNNGVPEANILDLERFCKNTMFYLAFVVLVFGHALLWCSPSEHPSLSDEEKEKIEEIKSRLKQKNELK